MLIQALGQTGYRLEYRGIVVFIDPYLSDSVREREGSHLERLLPIPVDPATIDDADYVLVTHEHLDHCDPDTLLPISKASPRCRFIAPPHAAAEMSAFGIDRDRITVAIVGQAIAMRDIELDTVPSAHPTLEMDESGQYCRVGYVLRFGDKRLYHAGDTGVHPTIISMLREIGAIDVGMIPVNEQNFYRAQDGIIGNMSIREAFRFAADIGVKTLVPTHWDMFASNQVFREEIELLYRLLDPPFALRFDLEMI
jgi:L-ascorbate metabolism protein UlaG (beta-lactamase superfamily)